MHERRGRPLSLVIVMRFDLPVVLSDGCRDVQDTVGIDVKGELDLRNTTRSRRNTGELNLPSRLLSLVMNAHLHECACVLGTLIAECT